MSYTILDVASDLEGVMHGTTINKVKNPLNLYYRAAREVLSKCDPAETKRIQLITNALYDKVYNYALPTDVKGNRIIDIYPQSDSRGRFDQFNQYYGKTFDLKKKNLTFTVENNSGVKTIRIAKDLTPPVVLSTADSITANGTWSVGGAASNLTVDTQNFLAGSGSLRFDTAATGISSTIENSTLSDIDLSTHEDESMLFIWVYIPSSASVSAMALRWGDDLTANYWNATATTGFNQSFTTGWNLVAFNWNTATETGSPDSSAVGAVRLTLTTASAVVSGYRIDNLVSNLGTLYNIKYYSKYLFTNSSGTWIERPTDDSDIVMLDTDSYNIFLFKVAEFASQQLQDSKGDVEYFRKQYLEALAVYKHVYKSEASTPAQPYYTFGNNPGFISQRTIID